MISNVSVNFNLQILLKKQKISFTSIYLDSSSGLSEIQGVYVVLIAVGHERIHLLCKKRNLEYTINSVSVAKNWFSSLFTNNLIRLMSKQYLQFRHEHGGGRPLVGHIFAPNGSIESQNVT